MTERLYYTDPFRYEFDARVVSVTPSAEKTSVVLDRSAFYPSSGGQPFDTGWLEVADGNKARVRVEEVAEDEQSGDVLHMVEGDTGSLVVGAAVRGMVDAERRRDHMQQHSGQHVLSAAFERLYSFPTVSFHLGDESCTIDLASQAVSAKQLEGAERLANEVIAENRPVEIRFATPDEARQMGVRKIPAAERQALRLIDIRDFDLNACGGTHVHSTGQIGVILLRKTEKVRQGVRVEFVCGLRAVNTARRDYATLTDAASLFSTHIWEVPQQVRKSLDEIKAAQKSQHRWLEEVAALQAERLLRQPGQQKSEASEQRLIREFFPDRDLSFLKMLAQKLTQSSGVVALLACGGQQPSLVFAQSPGLGHDMGAIMKQTVQELGTRGGGARDMAQGGAPDSTSAEQCLLKVAEALR
jgi:alanyl-tRNA synthetase